MALAISPSFSSGIRTPKCTVSVPCRRPVYFFLDYSNIAISAQEIAWVQDGFTSEHRVRLHARNLRALAERNREWKQGFAAAGLRAGCQQMCKHFDDAGIRIEVSERGSSSNREQNVDQRIQCEMLHLTKSSHQRGTVVLATGDGAAGSNNEGFQSVLENLLEHGYSIELFSWRRTLNQVLRGWVERHGRYIELDDFYPDITFIDGGRQATETHILNRKIAKKGLVS